MSDMADFFGLEDQSMSESEEESEEESMEESSEESEEEGKNSKSAFSPRETKKDPQLSPKNNADEPDFSIECPPQLMKVIKGARKPVTEFSKRVTVKLLKRLAAKMAKSNKKRRGNKVRKIKTPRKGKVNGRKTKIIKRRKKKT